MRKWATALAVFVAVVVSATSAIGVAGCGSGGNTTTTLTPTSTALVATTTSSPFAPPSESTPGTTSVPAAQNSWTDLHPSGTKPSVRSGQSMAYDVPIGRVIMFGGTDLTNGRADAPLLDDTWEYDPSANAWTKLNPTGGVPPARTASCLVYDPSTERVILFGGQGTGAILNDTWAYDPPANTWTDLDPTGDLPAARSAEQMAYDPFEEELIMFGGTSGGSSLLGDLWAYDPLGNTWTNLNPSGSAPAARDACSLVYDPAAEEVILFGGTGASGELSDTWGYNPGDGTWTDLNPSGVPPARHDACMAYDDNTHQIILFGGSERTGSGLNDTWSYDATTNTWTNLHPTGTLPSERALASLAHDDSLDEMILFGGVQERAAGGGAGLHDTWAYTP